MSILTNVTVKTEVVHANERNWEIGDVIASRWATPKGEPQLFMIGWGKDYGLFLINLCGSNGFSLGDIVTFDDIWEDLEQGTVIEDAYDLQQAFTHSYQLAKEVDISVKY